MNWSDRFRNWAFRWVKDEDGDIGFRLLGIVTFLKYKNHTFVKWFHKYENADKRQGKSEVDHFA